MNSLVGTLVMAPDPGVPWHGPSGASAHLRAIAAELHARHGAGVAVAREVDHRGRAEVGPDIPLVSLSPRKWGWLPRRFREHGERLDGRALLTLAMQRFTPRQVWVRHSLFFDAPFPKNLPVFRELNAPLALERGRYGRVLAPALAAASERRALQSSDRVFAVSAWLAEWAVREAGCHPDRVQHLPNGVSAQRGDGSATRASLNWDGPILGFVGSGRPWHGLERLPALLEQMPEALALVVGPTAPSHPRIRCSGQVPQAQVADLVAAMDVGLAPYHPDAPPWFCPLKVLEYLAQGVPVVAPPLGDIPWLLRHGGGVIVHREAIMAWTEAISEALHQPRVRRLRSWSVVVNEALGPENSALHPEASP